MAKKDKKKKSQVVPYKRKGMTFKDATNWLVPKKLKKVSEGIKKVRTQISAAAKKRADAKAAAQKPMDDYIAKKGLIPTKPMAKSGEMDVELTERIKGNPQGGSVTHTKDTRKLSPDKATGGYKAGSVAAKTQKKTLHGGKLATKQKELSKLEKQKEAIRNSDMTMTEKKEAFRKLGKKQESGGLKTSGQARQTEVLGTEKGQADLAAKMKRNRELAAKKKKASAAEEEKKKKNQPYHKGNR